MATTILLARHGRDRLEPRPPLAGPRRPPLNRAGRGRPRELAQRLGGEQPPRASTARDLARARETAEIVAAGTRARRSSSTRACARSTSASGPGLTTAEIEQPLSRRRSPPQREAATAGPGREHEAMSAARGRGGARDRRRASWRRGCSRSPTAARMRAVWTRRAAVNARQLASLTTTAPSIGRSRVEPVGMHDG